MAVFWIIFTCVHGPTSFDQTRVVLGRSTLFWGSLLSIPPNLLVALGLALLTPHLAGGAARLARFGFALTLFGLVVPAALDLFIWGGLGPPFFVPLVGAGLLMLARGHRRSEQPPRLSLVLLTFIGVSQIIAFAMALIPLEIADQVGGYRIYGFVAHLVAGFGWVAFGASLWKGQVASKPEN